MFDLYYILQSLEEENNCLCMVLLLRTLCAYMYVIRIFDYFNAFAETEAVIHMCAQLSH